MKKFGLIGAAGYIAPRHMKAIKETGNTLEAALDPNDSVGIIDSYFPKASFFTEIERFDRHVDKLRRKGKALDYISICSPNYLHDAHVRLALRNEVNVICEKPMVLNPENLDYLQLLEDESGKKINNILQLRLHDSIRELKQTVDKSKVYDVDLTYLTSRGLWYHYSWKGDKNKSGGLPTNIGIHFFDMLTWIFGDVIKNEVHVAKNDIWSGILRLENANVRWLLSCNSKYLPIEVKKQGKTTYRSLSIDEKEFEFSTGFTELHTKSYEEVLKGNGFNIDDVKTSIKLVHNMKYNIPTGVVKNSHPILKKL
jgi:UDP-N-acetyl-2-amino-2-deoxyglucuronate dehydrogenase